MTWENAVVKLKSNPLEAKLVRDCYYDDPIKDAAERFYNSSEWLDLRRYLPTKKGNALDIGAGRGISSFALAKDGWNVTALEPDNSNIVGNGAIKELIRETGMIDIAVVAERGENLPFPDNNFDLVYTRQSLHHADNLAEFCKEVERVLKPGGVLVASREHVIRKQGDLETFLNNHPLHKEYGGENAYKVATYKKALTDAGLTNLKILKTYDSDINLFPQIKKNIIEKVQRKIKLNLPAGLIVYLLNLINKTPGTLYTFIAYKK